VVILAVTMAGPGSVQRAAAQTCTVAALSQNAPANVSTNFYHRIDTAGAVADCHGSCASPTGYFPISQSGNSLTDGMKDREAWLRGTVPHQPTYRPFRDPGVQVIAGWMYNAVDRHNAIDYGFSGGAFPVHAPADGTVVWIGYQASPGNVVILEHRAPTGRTVRTIMRHLTWRGDSCGSSGRGNGAHTAATRCTTA
jgi:murein DD-endopeptidase MepM/ murein hydrolase activator NlpD